MPRIVVDVMLKPEILDPQGRAVQGALSRLGLVGVLSVRQGKRFEIEFEGDLNDQLEEQLEELAGSLLSNPVIEDWNLYPADEAARPAEQAKLQGQPIDEPNLAPAHDQAVPVDAADSDAAPVPDVQQVVQAQPDVQVQPDIESVSEVASVSDAVTVPDEASARDELASESAPDPDGASATEVTPTANQDDSNGDEAQLRAGDEGQR